MYAHFVFCWPEGASLVHVSHGTLAGPKMTLWTDVRIAGRWSGTVLAEFARTWVTAHLAKFARPGSPVITEMSDPSGRVPPMTERPERPTVPTTGGEREILAAMLDRHRATVEWKCRGLGDEQARRVHVPSALTTIAGLLNHLTLNEWYWFAVVLDGEEDTWEERLKEDPDAEFRTEAPMAELLADYAKQCERSREIVAARGLDDQVTHNGERFTVRWVATHMIEETARHLGHLDLLRELTDGLTGE